MTSPVAVAHTLRRQNRTGQAEYRDLDDLMIARPTQSRFCAKKVKTWVGRD
jgi:hypothetical protein